MGYLRVGAETYKIKRDRYPLKSAMDGRSVIAANASKKKIVDVDRAEDCDILGLYVQQSEIL